MERNPTEERIDELANRVGRFEDRFERFEDKVDARFDQFEQRVATKEDLNKLEARLDRWGQLMAGGVLAVAGTLIVRILGG